RKALHAIRMIGCDVERAEPTIQTSAHEALEACRERQLAEARLDRHLPDARGAEKAFVVTVYENPARNRPQLWIVRREPQKGVGIKQVPHTTRTPRSPREARRNRGRW